MQFKENVSSQDGQLKKNSYCTSTLSIKLEICLTLEEINKLN